MVIKSGDSRRHAANDLDHIETPMASARHAGRRQIPALDPMKVAEDAGCQWARDTNIVGDVCSIFAHRHLRIYLKQGHE